MFPKKRKIKKTKRKKFLSSNSDRVRIAKNTTEIRLVKSVFGEKSRIREDVLNDEP